MGVSAVTVLFVSAFGIRYFEAEAQPEAFSNYGDCLWWAVASLITGEYGDVSPMTTGGKAFATIILILSLAIIAAPGRPHRIGAVTDAAGAGTSRRRAGRLVACRQDQTSPPQQGAP